MSGRLDCPKCGEECWRDEVDIDVGVMYGPWGCPECGWSERTEYDRSGGGGNAKEDEMPGWHVDQWGRALRVSAVADGCERFGIPRDVVEDAFRRDPPS